MIYKITFIQSPILTSNNLAQVGDILTILGACLDLDDVSNLSISRMSALVATKSFKLSLKIKDPFVDGLLNFFISPILNDLAVFTNGMLLMFAEMQGPPSSTSTNPFGSKD